MDLGPTRVRLAHAATSTFPEGLEWEFLRLKEKSPFLPTSPASFLMDARKERDAGFLPMVRSDVAKGKSSRSKELTQRSLCKETDGLRLSEHNPWQRSASARWLLGCPSSDNFSLNLLRRQKGGRKLFPFLVLCAVSGHLLFSRRRLLVCVCFFRDGSKSPQSCLRNTP